MLDFKKLPLVALDRLAEFYVVVDDTQAAGQLRRCKAGKRPFLRQETKEK